MQYTNVHHVDVSLPYTVVNISAAFILNSAERIQLLLKCVLFAFEGYISSCCTWQSEVNIQVYISMNVRIHSNEKHLQTYHMKLKYILPCTRWVHLAVIL